MPGSVPVSPEAALVAPWGLFNALLLATFTAHLLAVNVALGGAWLALFTPGPDRGAARDLADRLPTGVAVAVNLAVPPLLFLTVLYGRFLYTAAILSAASWLALFLVVMLAYGLLYAWQPRAFVSAARGILGLAALLLLVASLILTNASSLMLRPEAWSAYFDQPHGTILNFNDPTFLPRWLHFVTASLAVAGLFLALINRKAAGQGDRAAAGRVGLGLAWFTRASLAQIAIGVWFLLSLPQAVRQRFLGGDSLDTGALLLALALAAGALVHGFRGQSRLATVLTVATVAAMVVVRDLVRQALLAGQYSPATLPVAPQYGPFVMFLISLALVGGLSAWMLAAHGRAAKRSRP